MDPEHKISSKNHGAKQHCFLLLVSRISTEGLRTEGWVRAETINM